VIGKPAHKRNIGMVFQDYALFPHMTVFNNIAFPLRLRKFDTGEVARKVDQTLKLVRLEGLGDRRIEQLSGGQQQRVALARAIVYEPGLLLMDEPLGALDKKIREHLQLEIKNIQKSLGITVIYVTHDQEEGLVMSDRIAVMRDGCIMQSGSPRTIYESPNCEFVADFLGDSNILEGELTSAPRNGFATIHIGDGITIEGKAPASRAKGEQVKCLIRPECLTLQPSTNGRDNRDNRLPGKIAETIYIGQATRYYLAVGTGHSVCVFEANRDDTPQPQIGAPVEAVCSRNNVMVL